MRRSGPIDPAEELECAVVERQDSVPLGFGPPRVDHLVELLGQLAGEVMTFREVFLDVVQRPLVLVEGGPFEVVCDGFPAILPQPAVPELLEVLRTATGLGTGLVPSGDEALAVQRDLLHALELRRQSDAGYVEHRRRDVDGMAEGGAHRASVAYARRPMDDQGIAHSAAVGILLIPAKGGVPGLRPPPWDVRVRVRPADVVEPVRHDFVDVLGYEIEEAELVHDAVRAALLAGPVVRAEHDEGVFEQTLLFEEAGQAADLRIRVVEEAGERLLQARGEYLLVLGQLRPRQHARVAGSEGRPTRDDPNFELPGEPLIADYVPTFEEASPVLLDVRLRRLVGGVHRAERQVEEEGPVGAHRPEVPDPADRLIDEVLAQVVPVLRAAGRLDMVVVGRQLGIELVRLSLQEAVEAVEALL